MSVSVTDLPIFVPDDAQVILNRIKSNYESLAGKNLQPAQAESLLIQAISYDIKILVDQFNEGARMQIVPFAEGPMLDYIVKFYDLVRLAESNAGCTIRFNLIASHGSVTIPIGTRVQSNDGKVVFRTIETAAAPSTTPGPSPTYLDVACECSTAGTIGNGYSIGQVTNLLDPYAFITTVSNTTASGGGADIESDDQLRERFYLAPSAFSNAGSRAAYEFWARSASSAIIDVAVPSIPVVPGRVDVYPMVAGGIVTPTSVINAVIATLSDDRIKALNDTLHVVSPTAVSYDVDVYLIVYYSADDTTVLATVSSLLDEYVDYVSSGLGRDVVVSEIIKRCKSVDGVYDAVINLPTANVTIAEKEFALLAAPITVAISSHTNG